MAGACTGLKGLSALSQLGCQRNSTIPRSAMGRLLQRTRHRTRRAAWLAIRQAINLPLLDHSKRKPRWF